MNCETEQIAQATLGIYVAATIMIGSYIALCVKCFRMSEGKNYSRALILLGSLTAVIKFIKNEKLGRTLWRYFLSFGFGLLGLLLSSLGYLSAP